MNKSYIGPVRAIGYVRVSTADQAENGASLDAQEAALIAEAERRGWVLELVREEGKSAKSIKGRELLIDALDRLDKGKADVLISYRLDRVSRSVVDFAGMLDRSTRKGWSIVLVSTGVDTTAGADPGSRFTAHIHAAAAEHERGLISMRTKEGMAQRAAEGWPNGRPGREVASDFLPTYARVIDLSAKGMSMNKIAATLNGEGVKTAKSGKWYASTVRAVLTSKTAKTLV